MNFKRGYKKDEKLVKYGSPKEFQSSHEPTTKYFRTGKRKTCKATKGDHEYVEVSRSTWFKHTTVIVKCKCGKISYKSL